MHVRYVHPSTVQAYLSIPPTPFLPCRMLFHMQATITGQGFRNKATQITLGCVQLTGESGP